MRENDPYGWDSLGPGFPRLALGLAWLVSTLAAGGLGWLLFAVPDRREPAALVLLGLAVLGLVATAAVVSNRKRSATLTLSLVASALFVAGGLVAVLMVYLGGGDEFVADLLMIGGVPVVAGIVTALLGRRSRAMSR